MGCILSFGRKVLINAETAEVPFGVGPSTYVSGFRTYQKLERVAVVFGHE